MLADSMIWLLDVSRLLARLHHPLPRGIDRVLLTYARRFTEHPEARFCAWACGAWQLVPTSTVLTICELLTQRWEAGDRASRSSRAMQRAAALTTRFRALREPIIASVGTPLRADAFAGLRRVTYVNVAHKELHRIGELRRAMQPHDVEIVVMLHDLMPIQRPEEFPPALRRTFRAGLDATRLHADIVLTNSRATAREVEGHWSSPSFDVGPRRPPVVTLALGAVDAVGEDSAPAPTTPHFVHLGAIEPRKNVQLLLSVWERFALVGHAVPRLYLIGDPRCQALVDRARSLAPHVAIRTNAGDAEVRSLLCGARALLAPSLAEGFGLPVVEALGLSTPVICSDLPSFREVSQGVAEHVGAEDRDGWAAIIKAYVPAGSLARRAQLARLQRFQRVRWDAHFRALDETLATHRDQGRRSSRVARGASSIAT